MKIAAVRSFLLSYPFREPIKLPFFGGERTILKRDAMLIRIDADNGLVGYAPGPGSERAHARHPATPSRRFSQGRTLADPDALRVQFLDGPGQNPDLAKVYCAVEIALYDLVAKALRRAALRNRGRPRARPHPPLRQRRHVHAARAIRRGGRAPSPISVFAPTKCVPRSVRTRTWKPSRLMRKAVGPDFDLMVDAHTWWRMGDRSYDFATVEQLAKEMAAYRVAWLEEPLPPDDHEAYRRLKDKRSGAARQRRA